MGETLDEESVMGLFSLCLSVTPWKPEGENKWQNQRSRVKWALIQHVPIECGGDKNNSPPDITNKIPWPGQSSCVAPRKHIVGYFQPGAWQWRMHRRLFINLTSQQWAGRSCEATSLYPQAGALQETKSKVEAGATCVCVGERKMSMKIRHVLPRSVGEPASLAFGSSTTTCRTEREHHASPSWHIFSVKVDLSV